MDLNLTVGDATLDAEDLHSLTSELRKSITTHTDADASIVTGKALPGTKGDPITLGTLALALITSGTVTGLVTVLQTFVARRPTIEFEVTRPDGQILKLKGDQLKAAHVTQTITVLEDFVGKA
jgi:hypothetical protein